MKKEQVIALVDNITKLKINIKGVDREDVVGLTDNQWQDFKDDMVSIIDDIIVGIVDMKGIE